MSQIPESNSGFTTSIPRKRVLSDIQNKPFVVPKRRHSSGPSLIKSDTMIRRKSGELPTGMASTVRNSTSIPMIHESLIDIDTCLNLKQKFKPGQPIHIEQLTSKRVQPSINLQELDKQITVLNEKVDDLQEEINTIVREQHKLKNKIVDLNSLGATQSRVLEREIDKSKRDRAQKEQMLSLQIQEMNVKLEDDFNELKFNLSSELANAQNYKNEEGWNDINRLKQNLNDLQSQIETAKQENKTTIKNESLQLKEELEKYIKSKESETELLATEFENKEKSLNSLNIEMATLQANFKSKTEESNELRTSIKNTESTMNDYPKLKTTFLSQLNLADEQVQVELGEQSKVDVELSAVRETYELVLSKLHKQDSQRRTLENSIMDYEGKLRVYAQGPEIYKKKHNFNKWFNSDIPDELITDESSCLTSSALLGCNVSLFIVGKANTDFTNTSVTNIYGHLLNKSGPWKYSFKFQLVSIGDSISDLLNINSPQVQYASLDKLQSQQMILDDITEFRSILDKQVQEKDALLYIIKVHGVNGDKEINGQVMVFNLTKLHVDKQDSLLRNFGRSKGSILSKIFHFSYIQSKCLFISRFDNENAGLSKALEIINSMDSPYKRRA